MTPVYIVWPIISKRHLSRRKNPLVHKGLKLPITCGYGCCPSIDDGNVLGSVLFFYFVLWSLGFGAGFCDVVFCGTTCSNFAIIMVRMRNVISPVCDLLVNYALVTLPHRCCVLG